MLLNIRRVQVQSAYEPSGSPGGCLSRFPKHEAKSISTPPPPPRGWDASPSQD